MLSSLVQEFHLFFFFRLFLLFLSRVLLFLEDSVDISEERVDLFHSGDLFVHFNALLLELFEFYNHCAPLSEDLGVVGRLCFYHYLAILPFKC